MNTTTVKLFVDTRRKLKLLSALLNKSMQEAAEEAIDTALVKAQKEADKNELSPVNR